jgi:hypothetical protein
MTDRGTDIDFDFFDEPETQEAQERARPQRARGPRPPMRPPAGFTPLLRLVGLIAFAILIVVLLVVWLQSCRSEGAKADYRDYMSDMQGIAGDSQQVGSDLNALLTTPGITNDELQEQLGGLAQAQEQYVTRAREIVPPGRLREPHAAAIEALQFRVSGLRRLQDAFQQGAQQQGQQATEVAGVLAAQMRRLTASDIVWDDLFMEPAVEVLRREDVGGVNVPDSTFLTNPDLATERAMEPILTRIRGASTGGEPTGVHGNGIVSVKALPSGQILQRDEDNFVVAQTDLAFEVTVENSGDAQEVRVTVRMTIEQSPRPIEKEAVVDIINAGERKTVVFRQLGQIVQFQQKTSLNVEVEPVPGEENTTNNTASYPVTFSLTPPS